MSFAKRSIVRLLASLGYTLARTQPVPRAVPLTPTGTPTEAIYRLGDIAFQVPVSQCCDAARFSYGSEGWSPFVATVREYGAGKHTTYEGSILERYYERFRPQTNLELFAGLDAKDHPLAQYPWSRLSIRAKRPRLPWQLTPIPEHEPRPGPRRPPLKWGYGPMPAAEGRAQFARFTRTYDSIKRHGYRPTGAPDGEIRGYFLRGEGGDYRFVVRDGLHRMTALAVLGHEHVRVKFRLHYARTIDLADLANWPEVRRGAVDPALAKLIFLTFFEGGMRRGRSIGLA